MARILAVTSRLPYPPREGHQLRSWHLLKAMATRHDVTLLSVVRDDDAPEEAGPLREILAGLELFPVAPRGAVATAMSVISATLASRPYVVDKYADPALRARFAELAADADLIHIDMLPLMALAELAPSTVPVAYNAHNVEHALVDTRARIDKRPLVRAFLRRQAPLLEAFERAACARADVVLACSAVDADILREMAPLTDIEVVPNGVDLEDNRPPAPASTAEGEPSAAAAPVHASSTSPPPARLVFVGQMGWFPNRDGVDWFLADVLPRILAKRPDVRFIVVGKSEGLQVPAGVQASVELAGFVPDVRPWVADAELYVVPLRAGSGTRLKVLEAMALGKAIVTTSTGSEGIALVDGESALFADDADSFCKAVIALLDDPLRAGRLGAAARGCAEARYGWEAIGSLMLSRYAVLLQTDPDTATDCEPAQGVIHAAG